MTNDKWEEQCKIEARKAWCDQSCQDNEGGVDSVGFIAGYLARAKKDKYEIDLQDKRIDALSGSYHEHEKLLKDRDQEIERLRGEINIIHPGEIPFLKASISLSSKLIERDELIKGLLKQVPYRKDLASDEIPNSIILQARKMVGE